MWCIPTLTPEFIERMEKLLALYEKPYNRYEPVICFDEKSKELHADTRPVIYAKECRPSKRDYEYRRNGVANIFLAVEPKGGRREVRVTKRRTKRDFACDLSRQALSGRTKDKSELNTRIRRWKCARNKKKAMIHWRFTRKDARNVFKYKAQN